MRYFLLIFLLLASPTLARAQSTDAPLDGQLTLVIKNLPKFSEYPAEPEVTGKLAADIDWKSDPKARMFRTALRDALKGGANFNGHYAVATYGCGTGCQGNKIVDVNNGKIVGSFTTSYGAAYRKDSSLIIANAPNAEPDLYGEYMLLYEIKFFKVEDDKLIPIQTLDIHKFLTNKKSD